MKDKDKTYTVMVAIEVAAETLEKAEECVQKWANELFYPPIRLPENTYDISLPSYEEDNDGQRVYYVEAEEE